MEQRLTISLFMFYLKLFGPNWGQIAGSVAFIEAPFCGALLGEAISCNNS